MCRSCQWSIIGQAGLGSSKAPRLGCLAVAETRELCAEYVEVSTAAKILHVIGYSSVQSRPATTTGTWMDTGKSLRMAQPAQPRSAIVAKIEILYALCYTMMTPRLRIFNIASHETSRRVRSTYGSCARDRRQRYRYRPTYATSVVSGQLLWILVFCRCGRLRQLNSASSNMSNHDILIRFDTFKKKYDPHG